MSDLKCTVVTPDATIYDDTSEFVTLTLFDGEIGIAPGRAPLIGRLGAGEMRITHKGAVARYFVDRGFVEVLDNNITVLTHEAIPADKLDVFVLQTKLDDAKDRIADTPEEKAQRDALIAEFKAKLRVAEKKPS